VSAAATIDIRRVLRPEDRRGIVELHRAVYVPEFGLSDVFLQDVAGGVEAATERGWPERSGAVWLIGDGKRLSGCLALTVEGTGAGRVRWFVLAPELRGQGLGRRLMGALLDTAADAGLRRLELVTFSALRTAGHIYRAAGFSLVSERETEMWGPRIVLQRYELHR
jgi:GNAT superfamily N-acetyltransferase